jgi:hypothetical protein
MEQISLARRRASWGLFAAGKSGAVSAHTCIARREPETIPMRRE